MQGKSNVTDTSMYELTTLWEDCEVALARGTRAGFAPILVATPAPTQRTSHGLRKLQRAFAVRNELDASWAARPLALDDETRRPSLVSEHPRGELLATQLGRAWEVSPFLRVARGIAAALRQLHARGLIHKDIKPSNVFADAATGAAWLTGFGTTSPLLRERQTPEPPEGIEGTLAYMAPEQTGRMNRSIDSRSDLYAFGVTLYELLAGALPFTASDPMEWVHCHIARPPPPLSSRTAGVPAVVCEIVMKLLAKTAEERYQTARGVESDLERALAEWEARGAVERFALGANDASDRLLLPEKLYGREGEIDVLLASLTRVLAHGDTQLVLVSGYSGIGKSSVVNELHRVLVPPRGLYAAGKFDQYKRDIPYATLAQAFVVLIRQVLGKGEREIAAWRDALTQALGANGQLIANLVPEIELVIGKQPPVPEVAPGEAQSRFQTVIRRFLAVFAQAEHPLALFLDDLQWLDAATLDLFEHLVGDPEVRHLLIVGAYRDNEVGPAHPLAATLEKLRRDASRVREIVLEPLAPAHVATLCSDALRADLSVVTPLSNLVHEKTGGNPFFVLQFITTLVDEGLLAFDAARASWVWDIAAIHAKGFTDNVVHLMAFKLVRFRPATQRTLQMLACLGNSARTRVLSLVCGVAEDAPHAVHEALAEAVNAGLVLRSVDTYAFLHDRVREAAYTMIPEGERAAEHLRIGRLLVARATPREIEENVFEIVNHLNRGSSLLEAQDQRDELAALNRIAGQRARASTAHAAARAYVALGRSLLGSDGWERCFRLTFDLELLLADAEFVTADLEAAEARLERLGARATSLTDRAAVIFVQTNLYTALVDRADRAVEICLRYLRFVGIDWAPHPTDADVYAEYQTLLTRIGGRSIDDLLNLPLLEDGDLSATIEVLHGLFTPAFNTDPRLVSLLLLRIANLGLEHGNSDATSLGYALLAMVLGSAFGDYEMGSLFGKLARDLAEKRGLERYRGRIYHILGCHVLHWTQHLTASETALRRGLRGNQEAGDVTYVSFGHIGLITILLGRGEPLASVEAHAEAANAVALPGKFQIAIDTILGQLHLVRALRGLLPDPCTVDGGAGASEDDVTMLAGTARTRGWYWIRVLQTCFTFGDMEAAHTAYVRATPLIAGSVTFFELAEYHFYGALTLAARFDGLALDARAAARDALAAHREQLATWAAHCPENFSNRVALLDAELARIDGRHLEAMEAYERAIVSSQENGFAHNEAVAFEVASRFYAGRKFEAIADAYVERACACYRRWGADGKVRALEKAHPRLRIDASGARAPLQTTDLQLESIDLASVVKTSQAVSVQVGVERLIESLMVIFLQHAGAERGLLVLRRTDGLWIEAEATTRADGVAVQLRHAAIAPSDLADSVLHYAVRTREPVLLGDAQEPHQFSQDPYFAHRPCRSLLCLPLVKQAGVLGALYLENNLTPHVFTPSRVDVLKLLASQAAISVENASLEEKDALLKEVHHRVKNNLQLISSMLNLQASRIKDPAVAELFADSRNRVRSMALVHENLYRAGNFSKIPMAAHIQTLCMQLKRAYCAPDRPVELVVLVGDLELEMNRAVTCGLIVNELVSNALKHAFPNGRAGRIQIDVVREGAGRHVLRVHDDGIGLPRAVDLARADTLGLQLVSDLTKQLRGSLVVTREPGMGTTFRLTFDEARTAPERHR